jgi:hypothetical protein
MDTQVPDSSSEPTADRASPSRPGSADPFAGWAPGNHDPIPVIPRGTALFEGIPAPAIVVEALAPVIGNGCLVSRRSGSVGAILVKGGAIFEIYAYENGARHEGEKALRVISGWTDATVSAYQLDPMVVEVAPSLFRGIPCYQDLRLEWMDWKGLLADLCDREGLFVVELDTPIGRGVTLIVNGRQVATYTEKHPEPGDEGLLDPLAATKRGTVSVLREPPSQVVKPQSAPEPMAPAEPAEVAPADLPVEQAAPVAPQPAPAPKAAPAISGIDWSTTPLWRAQPSSAPTGPAPSAEPFNPFAVFDPEEGPDGSWGGSVPVAEMAPALREVAQLHLQRSSPRVESMVDDAAARGQTLDRLLSDIRAVVIRGVMQSTIDKMADEMAAMAAAPPSR